MSALAVNALPIPAASAAPPPASAGEARSPDARFEAMLGDLFSQNRASERKAGESARSPGSSGAAAQALGDEGSTKRDDSASSAGDATPQLAALAAISYLGLPTVSAVSATAAPSVASQKLLSRGAALISAATQSALLSTAATSGLTFAPATTAIMGGSNAPANSGAPPADLAAKSWDLSGGTPLKSLLSADPNLGLQKFEMKTHLAAVGAAPVRAGATSLGADIAWPLKADLATIAQSATAAGSTSPKTNAQSSVETASPHLAHPSSVAAGLDARVENASRVVDAASSPPRATDAAAVASRTPEAARPSVASSLPEQTRAAPVAAPNAPPPRGGSTAAHGSRAKISTGLSNVSAPIRPGQASASPVSAAASTGSRRGGSSASSQSGSGAPSPDVVAASAPASTVAAASNSSPIVTLALADLPAFIADQAATLAAPNGSPSAPGAANLSKSPQVVKELQISLEPGDLGALTLKLRMTDGKLSVTIGVSNPSTLAAISSDRDAIAESLGAGQQKLDSIDIRPQSAVTGAESQNGADFNSSNFSNDSAGTGRGADDAPRRKAAPSIGDASNGGARSGGALDGYLV